MLTEEWPGITGDSMNKAIASLLTFFALTGLLRAELLIFKEVEVVSLIAAPGHGKLTVRGHFAYDSGSGMMSEIGITSLPNGSRYYIINTNFGEYAITRVPSSPRQLLVLSRVSSSNTASGLRMSTAFVKGTVYSLPTGTGGSVDFARSLKGLTRAITSAQGAPAYGESAITMAFSPSETKKANEAGESLEGFLNRWKAEFESRGYTQPPSE